MELFSHYKLEKESDGYTLILYINKNTPEFSKELGVQDEENMKTIDKAATDFIKEKLSDVKIKAVKIMLGALLIGGVPFMASQAQATDALTQTTQQNTMTHTVQSGDTLWKISQRYNVSITTIKSINNLQSDQLFVGQVLKLQPTTSSTITPLNMEGTITASRLNIRQGPSTNDSIIHQLWQGNKVKIIGESNGWYQIRLSDGRVGFVHKDFVNTGSSAQNREELIGTALSIAKAQLGKPYVWGATGPNAFDCSGFTYYVFNQVGYNLNRVSRDQTLNGVPVSRQNIQPGDLLFSSLNQDGNITHVGIYIGNGEMIHAPNSTSVVKITDMRTSYWESRFVTARRIIE